VKPSAIACRSCAEITKFPSPAGRLYAHNRFGKLPQAAGIGGSSAMAVAICAALDRFTGAGKEQSRLESTSAATPKP